MNNGDAFRLGQAHTPEQLQAMLRQQAPRPRKVDISTFRDLACVCGNTELEPEPGVRVKYDPLSPNVHVAMNFQRLKCSKCGMYPVLEGNEWKFVTEPPPIPSE